MYKKFTTAPPPHLLADAPYIKFSGPLYLTVTCTESYTRIQKSRLTLGTVLKNPFHPTGHLNTGSFHVTDLWSNKTADLWAQVTQLWNRGWKPMQSATIALDTAQSSRTITFSLSLSLTLFLLLSMHTFLERTVYSDQIC